MRTFLPVLLLGTLAAQQQPAAADPLRTTVRGALNWLARQAAPVDGHPDAVLFPGTVERPKSRDAIVYGGNAGILIFLENAAAVLDDAPTRELADKLARGLLTLQKTDSDGRITWSKGGQGAAALYVGDAGLGDAFLVRARLRHDDAALKTAVAVGDALLQRGDWNQDRTQLSFDDQVEVIYGASGTLLFLLELGEQTKEKRFVDGARAIGHWLIGQGKAEKVGDVAVRSWRWKLAGNQPYVNFSHGTAGVSYALARAGAATGDDALLATAREGAAWLQSQAIAEGDTVRWPVLPKAKVAMGGWCHGPAGTARLHLYLYALTGDKAWLETAEASARWLMAQAETASKAAAKGDKAEAAAKTEDAGKDAGKAAPQDGADKKGAFPPSFCCGVAGVTDFFCDLHRATGKPIYAEFARRAAAWLIAEAQPDGDGVRWLVGASMHENAKSMHNTDLMLGASGDAWALLRVLCLDQKADPMVGLPDRRVVK